MKTQFSRFLSVSLVAAAVGFSVPTSVSALSIGGLTVQLAVATDYEFNSPGTGVLDAVTQTHSLGQALVDQTLDATFGGGTLIAVPLPGALPDVTTDPNGIGTDTLFFTAANSGFLTSVTGAQVPLGAGGSNRYVSAHLYDLTAMVTVAQLFWDESVTPILSNGSFTAIYGAVMAMRNYRLDIFHTGQAAYTGQLSITNQPQFPVPLPAALPLFLTALGGMGAISGWRRRKAKQPA